MKKVAFIFPGQGSQSFGMGKDFYENSKIAKELIEATSDRLKIDMKKLMFEENEKLSQTEFTQSAILLVSSIASKIFQDAINIKPEFLLGHSLGEFSALVSADALDVVDGVELVYNRGLFMSEACSGKGAGMMALLGLDDEIVENSCQKLREDGKKIWAANYNSDGQIVLAGLKNDLIESETYFKDIGAKRTVVLNMSVASHCPILESAKDKLEPFLDKFIKNNFNSSIISNVTTEAYNSKDKAIQLLKEQLIMPVKYKQSIKANENKIDMFIELGNGIVLKGLNRKVTKTTTLNISDMKSLEKVIGKLQ